MNRTEIYTLGFPKSGNTWLARLIGDATQSEILSGMEFPSNADEGEDRPGPYLIRLRHYSQTAHLPGANDPTIQILRDPRDIMVSAQWYWGWSWEKVWKLMQTWPEQVQKWRGFGTGVRFENLLVNPAEELVRILDAMGLEYLSNSIAEVVFRQSWTQRQLSVNDEMPYGEKHQIRVLSTGKSGNWHDHLPREWRKQCHEVFWPVMHELGYEDDRRWWSR